jgi:nucleoside 2-deoxyribosyltransferase-like protein
MQVVYAQEALPDCITRSIFLLGPTPRSKEVETWRKEALQILSDLGYDGVVFVPEPRERQDHFEWERQVDWEDRCLNVSDAIVAWLPTTPDTMPGFTSRVELGRWMTTNKPIVLGYPEGAFKVGYLAHYAEKLNIPIHHSLASTLEEAIKLLGEGAERSGGDRFIPLYIWRTPQFQAWHKSQTNAGNYIENATIRYSHKARTGFLFIWIISMDIYIAAEKRLKKRDFCLARTDISSVMLWKPEEPIEDSKVILVSEFRHSANNQDARVHELPSGSSANPAQTETPLQIAEEEVREETGFDLPIDRFRFHGARQLASTLSAHKSHLFSAKLSAKELEWFETQVGLPKGNADDGERTYIEVKSIKEIWEGNLLDWTTIGQILTVARQG